MTYYTRSIEHDKSGVVRTIQAKAIYQYRYITSTKQSTSEAREQVNRYVISTTQSTSEAPYENKWIVRMINVKIQRRATKAAPDVSYTMITQGQWRRGRQTMRPRQSVTQTYPRKRYALAFVWKDPIDTWIMIEGLWEYTTWSLLYTVCSHWYLDHERNCESLLHDT